MIDTERSATSHRRNGYRRLRLRRADGRVYLNRWGIGHERIGRILVHRMDAPDPGLDLHDHPWSFLSLVLWGGYVEERANIREAVELAYAADTVYPMDPRGEQVERRPLSLRSMRLDECHRITELRRRTCWTLVIGGPRRRSWGFYTPTGWLTEAEYDRTLRAQRRDLWSDQNVDRRPW